MYCDPVTGAAPQRFPPTLILVLGLGLVGGLITLGPLPVRGLDLFQLGLDRVLPGPAPSRQTAEMIGNVLLFVPGSLLLRLSLHRQRAIVSILYCAVAAVAVEGIQTVLPDRHSGVRDVLLNLTGTLIGVTAAEFWLRCRRRTRP